MKPPKEPVYLGNAGTATRFLTTLCTFVGHDVGGKVVLTGDKVGALSHNMRSNG